MKELILDWKRSADEYRKLGQNADHLPITQEGWLCRSEVYNYCASRLEDRLQQAVEADAENEPCPGYTCHTRPYTIHDVRCPKFRTA